ncbi:SpaA isopeptide-forming pilin-related protein [Ruminococcus sp.]|uniref:DUF7601 domain-containing protein n=1 Tax=Ruminococcus sp. TaxID=41978 RepID=UPI0025CE9BB9|nr:SpaA isopeptide-forming pilin-related protein [Ruminococcus sp.]MBQ8965501.1 BspA family leucine-rich repeat surface protein [Ruminococcus sp.]
MRNRFNSLIKRIVSGLSAAAMLIGNAAPIASFADEPIEYAHTINLFDIQLTGGADYSSAFKDDNAKDETAEIKDGYVWTASNSNSGHKFIYSVDFSLSGQGIGDNDTELIKERFVEIHIPAHILRLKGQTEAGGSDAEKKYGDVIELSVPKASDVPKVPLYDDNGVPVKDAEDNIIYTYDTDYDFLYEEVTGQDGKPEIVIYNIKPISAGQVYEFPMAYKMLYNTWDYEDLEVSDAAKASVIIDSWPKDSEDPDASDNHHEIKADTREIPVYINTGVQIQSTSKSVKQNNQTEFFTADQLEKLSFIKDKGLVLGDEKDNYLYMVWQIDSKVSTVTQKYDYTVSDKPGTLSGTDADGVTHTVEGQFVAMNIANGNFEKPVADDNGEYSLTAENLTGNPPTALVITRYEKTGTDAINNAPRNGSYKAVNDAEGKVTPLDKKDKETTRTTQAEFIYERKKPSIPPVIESYTASKKGLTTSYELNNILQDNTSVTGLKYSTEAKMHSYGNTIEHLNEKLTKSITAVVNGNNISVSSPLGEYTAEMGSAGYEKDGVSISTAYEMTSDLLLKIVASELAESFYGQENVTYSFTDKNITLLQPGNSANTLPLEPDDYYFSGVEFAFSADRVNFDADTLEFSGEPITNRSDYDQGVTLDLYAYINGSPDAVLAAKYHPDTNTFSDIDTSIVSAASSSAFKFADGAKVTGYQLTTSNEYFCVQLNTKPTVAINPTERVKNFLNGYGKEGDLKQVNVQNTGAYDVKAHDDTSLFHKAVSGTDLVSQDKRTSSITKTARNENDAPITGKDGESYKTINDTLNRQYIVTWETKVQELYSGAIDGVTVNNVPVEQQSGVFYDLLPLYSDVIEGSVNVYIDDKSTPLPSSSFKVLPREDDHAGSGQKLMTVEIYAPCQKNYRLTYATVHSHADIQDYGPIANNTIAYQTGNENIGGGYPDNGGNHAVSKSAYMIGLDPDNGNAKRFIYAEATENIVALIQTASGIFKYVSSKSDPSQKQSAVVHPSEDYTYHFRMKNASTTKARDIAILDSIENYRTKDGIQYNYGINKDRDWNGTVKSFNLSAIENRMGDLANDLHLFVYKGNEIIDLDDDSVYSNAVERQNLLRSILGEIKEDSDEYEEHDGWEEVNWKDPGDLGKVTAFIVYTGEEFTLPKGASMSFTVTMTAPKSWLDTRPVDVEDGQFLTPLKTYNNVYRSFTNMPIDPTDESKTLDQYYYTHFDYTEVSYMVTGDLEFTKNDSKTGSKIEGVQFNLAGISDYGKPYDETLTSDKQGKVLFEDLERGTYTLTETISDDDHILDKESKKVTVRPDGLVTIVEIDGTELEKENGIYKITNEPRPHTDIVFSKVDSVTGGNISGAKFTLKGTSDLNTSVDMTEYSTGGTVTFSSVEPGTYTLTEEYPADGYAAPATNSYTVTVTKTGNYSATFSIEGIKENTISNDPLASTKLIKADSISKNPLDGAVFTVTAPTTLNDRYAALQQSYIKRDEAADFKWTFDGTNWKQTVTGGSIKGEFDMVQLIPGSGYTLSETTAPKGYATIADKTFSVTGGKVVFDDSNALEYLVLNISTHEYDDAYSPENADYIRIGDEPTYEDKKNIDKSWVGEITVDPSAPKFPTVHLKNEKPSVSVKVVTIGDGLKTLIQGNKANFTGLERSSTKPDNAIACKADVDGEDGEFYAWWDPTDKKVKWWSDANIIYLPESCQEMFKNCNNSGFTSIDLNDFNGEKVTTMQSMFEGCSNLTSIDLSSLVTTDKLTNMSNMFKGCEKVTSLDLSGFTTSNVTTFASMFENMKAVTEIKLDYTKFTAADKLTSVDSMFSECRALQKIDLRGFSDCPNLETINKWFYNCFWMEYIDLSNFSTGTASDTKLSDIRSAFMNLGNHGSGGTAINATCCKIFAKCKWNTTSNCSWNKEMDDCFRINLYDSRFKNAQNNDTPVNAGGYIQGNPKHLDVVYHEDYLRGIANGSSYGTFIYNGKTNDNDSRLYGPYFNSAYIIDATEFTSEYYSDYYKSFFTGKEGYSFDSTNALNSASRPLFAGGALRAAAQDYSEAPNGFTVLSPAEEKEVDEDPNRKTEFVYEYITGEAGTFVSEREYTVPQTINLTIRVPLDDTHVTEYYYTKETTATWKKVINGDSPDWQLVMNVNNADEEFYLWEEKFGTYKADTSENNPKITKGDDGKALLVNTATDQDTGSLKLKKTMENDIVLDPDQTFTFNVVMKKSDNSAYTKTPFDANGQAEFELKANEEIILSGLPVGAKYTVSETIDDTALYEIVTAAPLSGTIRKNEEAEVVIENRIITNDLTLSKTSLLNENDGTGTLKTLSLDDDTEWRDTEFSFTVNFSGLVPEYPYSWLPSGKAVDKNGNVSFETKLKQSQNVTFSDLPATAKYTITEETLTDTSLEEYAQTNTANTDGGVTTGQQTVKDRQAVEFTNTKTLIHDKYVITVKKIWFDENGNEMPIAEDGTVMKYGSSEAEPTIPSFLNTYLGRALKYTTDDGKTYYMSVEPKFMTVKLNKDNKWQQEIADLEKSKEVSVGAGNTVTYKYVYFLWEDCPTAYTPLINGADTETINSDEYKFFRDATVSGTAYTYSLQNKKVPTYTLEVDKTVAGNLGNKAKDFSFVIRFTAADGTAITGTGLRATFNGERNRTITLNNDGTFPFTLSHGEKIVFEGLPKNTGYILTENQADDYITSITRTVGSTEEDPVNNKTISGTLADDHKVLYTNTLNGTLPTGIDLSTAATAAVGLLTMSGIGYLKLRRRKETE